jgi:hypothetical protein
MKALNRIACIFFIPLFLLINICSCVKIPSQSKLIGTWSLKENPSSKYVFNENGSFKFLLLDSVEFFHKNSSRYRLVNISDTLWVYTKAKAFYYGEKGLKSYRSKMALQLNGDFLTKITYKGARGIENHIDEYGIWVKHVPYPVKVDYKGSKIIYIIPEGFKGEVWIAFNQEDGVLPIYDSLGNPMLMIPECGILQTTIREDAFATANKHYTIISTNQKDQLSPLETFDKFDRNVSYDDSTCCETNKTYAFMEGFNQTSREDINENIFGKPISGNVMNFYIGTHSGWANKEDNMIEEK